MKKTELRVILPLSSYSGKRLDYILSCILQEYSRSSLKKWIIQNKVLVNNKIENNPDKKMLGGENILIYPCMIDSKINLPENIYLDIIYEDQHLLVINKPVGMVVHPGSGNDKGTILNALLYKYKEMKDLPRAGIVHRLDKNTSGLMVIAKHQVSYNYLVSLLKKRKIVRRYQAIVQGKMISGGIVDASIMRHYSKRTRMMVHDLGKKAITHYTIIHRFSLHTHISLRLETGRTHQIRVHMLHIGYPIIGDRVYCRHAHHYPAIYSITRSIKKIYTFPRQALHANYLSFYHPFKKQEMSWSIPLPQDMLDLLMYL